MSKQRCSYCIRDIRVGDVRQINANGTLMCSDCMGNEKESDVVNHPSHYTQGGIECIDALAAATASLKGIEAVCTANVIKYLWRWKEKNGTQDLRKAEWYLKRLIQEVEHEPKQTL